MGLIDFILNLAGLLWWLNWHMTKADPLGKKTATTLLGTLRRAEPIRLKRWHFFATLAGFLGLRALFYWQIGPAAHWTGRLNLGVIELSFRSDWPGRMLLFSVCSFGLALVLLYLALLFFSIVAERDAETEPVSRLVRTQLGGVDRWSRKMKWILPLAVAAAGWWGATWLFAWLQIIPQPVSALHRLEQALVVGFGSYLTWKYVAAGVLVLHLLNSYIYFGAHPLWNYLNGAARTLLRPLRGIPLRAGKIDFATVVALALVFLIAEALEYALAWLYAKLPL